MGFGGALGFISAADWLTCRIMLSWERVGTVKEIELLHFSGSGM